MQPLITCEDLSVRYDAAPVVGSVSFDIIPGDYLCIVGENGSGKSTLMKCVLGLIKPSGGKIEFNGLKQAEIGYMPQQTPQQKDFPASVTEVVLSGCLNHERGPFYTKRDKEHAFFNMQALGIENLRSRSYRELSGGQQQRVLLARALSSANKLLMLDEPAAGLDPMSANEMYSLLKRLNEEQELAVVMISHDINAAALYGKKILHLNKTPLYYGEARDYRLSEGGRMMGLSQGEGEAV